MHCWRGESKCGKSHRDDERLQVLGQGRTSCRSRLPSPEQSKPSPVPTNECARPDNRQRLFPGEEPAQNDQRDFCTRCRPASAGFPFQDSTILTSQLPVARWHEQIGDPTAADGILDRLVHNAHRIDMRGDSMRKKRGLQE